MICWSVSRLSLTLPASVMYLCTSSLPWPRALYPSQTSLLSGVINMYKVVVSGEVDWLQVV